MALPTFSAEAIIRDRCALLDISTTFLSALAGIPQSRLSLAFSGTRPLSGGISGDAEALMALTAQLVELADALAPVPLAMNDPGKIRLLLDEMKTLGITAQDVRTAISGVFNAE